MDEDEDVARELEELEKLPYDLYLDDVDQSVVDWPLRGPKSGVYPRRGRGGRGGRRARGVRSSRGEQFNESESDMFDVEAGGDSKWEMESIKEAGGEEYGYGQSSRGGHRGPPGFKPFGRSDENVKEERGAGDEYGYGTTRGGHRGPPGFKPFGRAGDDEAGSYGRGSYERSWSTEEDGPGGTAGLPTFAPHRKDPRLAGKHGFDKGCEPRTMMRM